MNTVDERIVSMKFNNSDFEQKARTSLSTLEKLKSAFKMDGASKGLEGIGKAVGNVNMAPLSGAVEKVGFKFKAMEVMAITALANITNSAINTGKRVLESLTIAPVREGFSEYELKMGSVQTIMASTGESLNTVMGKLNELNTYADKTIYSFSDMTTNIGKFTNAGVSLNDSVAAIQGVANVAAVSGANANEASRAMYNFAQALSAGYVKLIDWKSIENANMATVEFKNELIKTAVAAGTLKDNMDGTYTVLSTGANGGYKEAISATQNFNDSLSAQWMTTEVLTETLGRYADETTDIGKKAFAAAQDVKTFTQLMDTIKEAVGSGWAETWELVIGNFDQAKELWTGVNNVVSGFIDRTSKARNDLLKLWQVAGGRTKLIASFKNTFNAVLSVVKPIQEAFREIFPPMTAKRLVDLTKKLQVFTRSLRVTKTTATMIHDTFLGLFNSLSYITFSISDIAKTIGTKLMAAFNKQDNVKNFFDVLNGGAAVVHLLGQALYFILPYFDLALDVFISFGEALLSGAALIGRFVSSVTGLIHVADEVSDAGFFGFLNEAVQMVVDFFNAIKTTFDSFGQIDTSGLKQLSKKAEESLSPFLSLFDSLGTVLNSIKGVLKSAFKLIGSTLSQIFDSIGASLANVDFERLIGIIAGGGLAKLIIDFDKLIKKLTGGVGDFSGMFKSVSKTFDAVRESLELWQSNLKAKTLMTIAAAIGIIALSLVMLSGINAGSLAVSLGGVAGAMLILMNAMGRWTEIIGPKKAKQMAASSFALVAMAISLSIMASAVKKLGSLKPTEIAKGVAAIAALSFVMVKVAKTLSQNEAAMMKGIGGLILFAITLRMLVKPVKELGEMNTGQLLKGLGAIFVLVSTLGAFLNRSDFQSGGASAGAGLLLLAIGLRVLASAVEKLGSLDAKQLAKGLGSVLAILVSLGLFTIVVSGEKMIATATGLLILSGAIAVLAQIISSLGGKDWKELAKGVGAIAATLLSLAVAAKIASGSAMGAVAILIMANALAVLFPVLYGFSKMDLGQIAMMLLSLGSAFAIIGVGAALLAPLVPALLGLGAAILLIGAGAFAAGAGVAMLAAGLTTLAGSGIALSAAFILAIMTIIESIPRMIAGIVVALLESAGDLITAVVTLGKIILSSIRELVPDVISTGLFLLSELLNSLLQYGPQIVETGYQLLMMLLQGLSSHIEEIGATAVGIIVGLINALSSGMGQLVQAGIDLALSFINGLADGIRNNAPAFKEALFNLLDAGIDALITFATPGGKIAEVGKGIIDGILQSLGEGPGALFEAMVGLGSAIFDGICSFLGIASPSTKMISVGGDVVQGLINGIGNFIDSAISKIAEVADGIISKAKSLMSPSTLLSTGMNLIQGLISGISSKGGTALSVVGTLAANIVTKVTSKLTSNTFYQTGKNAIQGLINGMSSLADKLANKTSELVNNAIDRVRGRKGFDEGSPSKVMIRIGRHVMEGWEIGMIRHAHKPLNAIGEITDSALDNISWAMSKAYDILNSEVDPDLTIRPVMDLSDVYSGVSDINSMLSTDRSIALAGRTSVGMNAMAQLNQNGIRTNNTDVVGAINTLRSDVAELQTTIRGLRMVLDTGALVGGIADPMDEALGFRAVMAGRGV